MEFFTFILVFPLLSALYIFRVLAPVLPLLAYTNLFNIFLSAAFIAINSFRVFFFFNVFTFLWIIQDISTGHRYVIQWLVYVSTLKISLYCLLPTIFCWEVGCLSFSYPLKFSKENFSKENFFWDHLNFFFPFNPFWSDMPLVIFIVCI